MNTLFTLTVFAVAFLISTVIYILIVLITAGIIKSSKHEKHGNKNDNQNEDAGTAISHLHKHEKKEEELNIIDFNQVNQKLDSIIGILNHHVSTDSDFQNEFPIRRVYTHRDRKY